MDYTIRIKIDGADDAKVAAANVRAINSEVAKAQKAPAVKGKVDASKLPRAAREAKEDRELDRAADKAQKAIIKEAREQEKLEAKRLAGIAKAQAAKERADAKDATARAKEAASEAKAQAKKQQDEAKAAQRKADQDAKTQAKASALAEKEEAARIKAANKLAEKESKDLDRAAEKAKKALAADEKTRAKDAEKAELAKIDPKYGMSTIEKAKAAKQKESEKGLAEQKKETNEKLFKPLMIGAAVVGAAIVGAMGKFAPLALGYQGMARLSMISQVASFNLRRLFVGTNPRPLLDAIQRTGQLLDPRTFTGDQLGQFLRRTSDGVMSALAKAEPYVRLFFKGMLLGAMQVENGFLRFRIAVQPALNLIPKSAGQMATWQVAAMGVKGALAVLGIGATIAAYKGAVMGAAFVRAGLVAGGQFAVGVLRGAVSLVQMGASALAATAPLLPFIAAMGAAAIAIKQAIDLKKQWDESSSTQISNKLKADLGITSKEEASDAMAKRQGIITGDDYDRKHKLGKYAETAPASAAPVPKGTEKVAMPAGKRVGDAMADGLLAGLKAGEIKASKGGADLVLAAEGGAKAAAEIRSPSRKWRREIGAQLGAGASLGIQDSADDMALAASSAMPSPGMGGVGGVMARGRFVIQQIGPFFGMPSGGEEQVRRWVFDALDDAAERVGALA